MNKRAHDIIKAACAAVPVRKETVPTSCGWRSVPHRLQPNNTRNVSMVHTCVYTRKMKEKTEI